MKLHCPHCGVKGSAEDVYSGRKVQCPKCQGVFEVKPEMALALAGEVPLESEPSTTPTELVAALEEFDRAVGGEKEPAVEGREALELEDIASALDPQSADRAGEEEPEVDLEQSPVELPFPEDDSGQPASDRAEVEPEAEGEIEIEETLKSSAEAEEEVVESEAETAVAIAEGTDEDKADNQGVSAQSDQTAADGQGDEALGGQEKAEVELEPYGLEKEQCWQCGKKDNLGKPFITSDGRMYCADCANKAEIGEESADSGEGTDQDQPAETPSRNFEQTGQETEATADAPPGPAPFSIGAALSSAWAMISGAKGAIWAGSAVMYLVLLVIAAGGMTLLRTAGGDMSSSGLALNMVLPVVINVCFVIFIAGLLLMGIHKVAGERVSWKMIFAGFPHAGKIIVATVLQSLLVGIGFLLLVLPGIYLAVGYVMTIPLIVREGLSPWQAMEKSRKAVHKVWWRLLGLYILMSIIFSVSAMPLGIGLIWTWPMFLILAGVLYRQLFGAERADA